MSKGQYIYNTTCNSAITKDTVNVAMTDIPNILVKAKEWSTSLGLYYGNIFVKIYAVICILMYIKCL